MTSYADISSVQPGGQITPGAITYTTSTGNDGRVVYHPFKAVPASYQTPSGVVSGIQWVPAEATQILPANAQPANAEFAASWNRGYLSREDERSLKDWQRTEEKRRRKEEKESSKRVQQWERERREDDDFRRPKDGAIARSRRNSFNYATSPSISAANPAGYPVAGSSGGYPAYPPASSDLDRRFGDMGIGGGGSDYTRERRLSSNYGDRPSKYAISDTDRRKSGNFGDRPGAYGTTAGGYPPTSPYSAAGNAYPSSNIYGNTGSQYGGGNAYPSSPNMRPVDAVYPAAPSGYTASAYPSSPNRIGEPFPRSASPYGNPPSSGVYPRGHIMEGQPIPRSRATTPSRDITGRVSPSISFPSGATFPQPSGMSPHPSPRMGPASLGGGYSGEAQLTAPEGFSRPRNAALSYTYFETMKIQDMDDFLEHIPRMPLVLQPHDVYHEDWIRLMQDLSLAWGGRLPVPELARGAHSPKRSTLAADLIDLWNASFFLTRGVEVVLYKGRERRSGPNAGQVDMNLLTYDDDDDSDMTSSSSEDSELSGDDKYRYGNYGGYGAYGRQNATQMTASIEARRRRSEKKAEKKRRRKEKKLRRRVKDRERKYALYLMCIPQGGYGGNTAGSMPGGLGGVGGMGGMGGMGGISGGMGGMGGMSGGIGGMSGGM